MLLFVVHGVPLLHNKLLAHADRRSFRHLELLGKEAERVTGILGLGRILGAAHLLDTVQVLRISRQGTIFKFENTLVFPLSEALFVQLLLFGSLLDVRLFLSIRKLFPLLADNLAGLGDRHVGVLGSKDGRLLLIVHKVGRERLLGLGTHDAWSLAG